MTHDAARTGAGLTGRGILVVALLTIMLGVILTACGSDTPTATPTPPPAPTATSDAAGAPDAEPEDTFTAAWEELKAKAREEGELVMLEDESDLQGAYDLFEAEFGVRVIHGSGTSGTEAANRILLEQQQGLYEVDINTSQIDVTGRFISAGGVITLADKIIHPDALDLSKWRFNKLYYTDAEGKYSVSDYFQVREGALEVFYNTEKVTQEEVDSIKTLTDLLDPKWEGRVAVSDLTTVGGARSRLWRVMGKDFISDLYTMHNQYIDGYRSDEAAKNLALGKYDVAIGFRRRTMEDVAALGLPIGKLSSVGTPFVTIVDGEGIFANAPHPNAALLYWNWRLTQEGQTALQTFDTSAGGISRCSLRLDVPQGVCDDSQWALVQALTDDIEPFLPSVDARAQSLEDVRAIFRALDLPFG